MKHNLFAKSPSFDMFWRDPATVTGHEVNQHIHPTNNNGFRDQLVGGLRWFSPYRAVINLNERHKSRWYPSKNTLYTLVIRNFTTSQYGEEKWNTTFLLKDQALTCLGRSGEIMEAAEFRLKSGVFHVWHASAWAFVRPNNYQYLIYIIGHLFQTLG